MYTRGNSQRHLGHSITRPLPVCHTTSLTRRQRCLNWEINTKQHSSISTSHDTNYTKLSRCLDCWMTQTCSDSSMSHVYLPCWDFVRARGARGNLFMRNNLFCGASLCMQCAYWPSKIPSNHHNDDLRRWGCMHVRVWKNMHEDWRSKINHVNMKYAMPWHSGIPLAFGWDSEFLKN